MEEGLFASRVVVNVPHHLMRAYCANEDIQAIYLVLPLTMRILSRLLHLALYDGNLGFSPAE